MEPPPPGPPPLPSGGLKEFMDSITGRQPSQRVPPPSPTASSTSASTSSRHGSTNSSGAGGSYLDFLIGDPTYRHAKAQLTRYRSSLAAEAARAEAGAQRALRGFKSFQAEAQRDGEHLARTGGRHLGLFEYMAGLRASVLRLELAQWQRATRLLRAREGEAAQALEGLQALLAASEGGGLDEGRYLRPSAQEVLAGDAELLALRRRARLLGRVCENVGAEASLLVMGGVDGGAEGKEGCEGGGAGLEGPVESVEERRRKLTHLAEEAAVLYFGGNGGKEDGEEEEEEGNAAAAAGRVSPTATASEGAHDRQQGVPCPAETAVGRRRQVITPESLQRQREVVQLRLKCEREFACLVADQRLREGRLLERWLELLKEVAGEEEEEELEERGEDGADGLERSTGESRSGNGGPTTKPQSHAQRSSSSSSSSSSSAALSSAASGHSSSASGGGGGLFPACDAPLHAPRCIAAFVQYLAVKRIKEPYQLADRLKPALVGLTQSLVFRRARRVCFGYVKGSAMQRLNRTWREKMLLVRGLSPQALGVPDAYVPRDKAPYQETSKALAEMALCLTPQEMSDCLLTGIKALHVEARLASGSKTFVDADTLFPVLLYALSQADIPDMYSCLFCLTGFAAADYVGEKAYFITTLSAAVSHLQQLEVEEVAAVEEQAGGEGGGEGLTTPTTTLRVRPSRPRKDSVGGGGPQGLVGEEEDLLERWGPRFTPEETRRALEYLDGWIAMERNMEETIDLLEDGGWW